MLSLASLWIKAFTNPVEIFEHLKTSGLYTARFTWWTSFFIYIVGYFSVFSIIFEMNATRLGAFFLLIVFFLLITFTTVKNYFYTLLISYSKKELVSYSDVCLISALSDIPLLFIYPLCYALSLWVSNNCLIFVLFIISWILLRRRASVFRFVYQTSGRFVYFISFGLVLTLFLMSVFLFAYLGASIQVLMQNFLS